LFRNIVGRTTNDFFKLNFPNLERNVLEKILFDYQIEYRDKIVNYIIPVAFTNDFIRSYKGDTLLAVASGSDTKVLDTSLKHLGLHDKFTLTLVKNMSRNINPTQRYIYTLPER
jgi:hypothetical protein